MKTVEQAANEYQRAVEKAKGGASKKVEKALRDYAGAIRKEKEKERAGHRRRKHGPECPACTSRQILTKRGGESWCRRCGWSGKIINI